MWTAKCRFKLSVAQKRTVIILRNESKFQKTLKTLKPLGINLGSPVEANLKLIPPRSGFKIGTHQHMAKLQVRQTRKAWEWVTIIQKGPRMEVKLQILLATHIIRIKMLKWLGSDTTGISFSKLIKLLYSKTWWWIKSNLKWLKAISIRPMWACPMRWSICSRLLITEVCFYKLFLRKCLFHNSSMTIQEIWLSKAKCFSRSTSKSAKNASGLVLFCSLKLYHRQVFQKGKL